MIKYVSSNTFFTAFLDNNPHGFGHMMITRNSEVEKPDAAGFLDINRKNNKVTIFGKSITLRLGSRPEVDIQLMTEKMHCFWNDFMDFCIVNEPLYAAMTASGDVLKFENHMEFTFNKEERLLMLGDLSEQMESWLFG